MTNEKEVSFYAFRPEFIAGTPIERAAKDSIELCNDLNGYPIVFVFNTMSYDIDKDTFIQEVLYVWDLWFHDKDLFNFLKDERFKHSVRMKRGLSYE